MSDKSIIIWGVWTVCLLIACGWFAYWYGYWKQKYINLKNRIADLKIIGNE